LKEPPIRRFFCTLFPSCRLRAFPASNPPSQNRHTPYGQAA